MATNKPTAQKPQIAPKNIPKDAGLTIAWKDGLVSSSLGKKWDKKSYDEKAQQKSIRTGMDHVMSLLVPPFCLQPHLWEEQEDKQEPPGHATSRHRDNLTNNASPGKAPNGTWGSCFYGKCTNDASHGKATNGTLEDSSH